MSENTRRRGAQPGNHNALKHGRYIAKANLPIHHYSEEEQITVIDHLIRSIKHQMNRTAEQGKKAQNLHEVLKTMNSLSMAAIGLCRLMHKYNQMTCTASYTIPEEGNLEEEEKIAKMLASYDKVTRGPFAG